MEWVNVSIIHDNKAMLLKSAVNMTDDRDLLFSQHHITQ